MSSYVAIANRAAVLIGTASRLTDPTDDTPLGRAVSAVYEIERKAALRAGAWNFAIKRKALPALVAAPAFGFARAFEVPPDFLKLIEVRGIDRARYQIEGRKILSDAAAPLQIRYLADIREPALFDASFTECFAIRIAITIGNQIAGSSFDEGLNWQKYRLALRDAGRNDALENPGIEQEESDWLLARERGADSGYFAAGVAP